MTAAIFLAEAPTPNYALRRAVAALLALVVAVVLVGGAFATLAAVEAVIDLGGRPAAASENGAAPSGHPTPRVHVAQPGDSLWSIAEIYRGTIGRGAYLDALIHLNGGTGIQAGQPVRLP